ncbi:hypothetical protein TTHERM_00975350 (macronuclear) [Tetrahymena thermophila SB210]|uniref:Uncharacterized protein n=1 Tax=Tetrahymena thermophila (strain SB210) TaxID=312017 RepID=Q22WQ7_TETTS|nr:hypothetical protein TTHERM_00975350 [Tetrahymena thermophila SB210]EAR89735.1 hypothetical protein TTHERM_00975350 [Tetrahymena thermophila SB210]|eukprot:XP_001009980.1 hypothetical protein TTHERM_00975350 [Tetrahymena thermophila SB210]
MSMNTESRFNSFQQQQQIYEKPQKIQIPKVRGNLSSFNDLMNYDSMKIESQALNNLRNMSEDKLDQYLTNINSTSNITRQNTNYNNNYQASNNSIMTNNMYYQNFYSQNIVCNQPFSPEKRKSSNIVGWDHDDSTLQQIDCLDLQIEKEQSIIKEEPAQEKAHRSQSQFEKQNSSHSSATINTALTATTSNSNASPLAVQQSQTSDKESKKQQNNYVSSPIIHQNVRRSLSKKSSYIQLTSSATDLSVQNLSQIKLQHQPAPELNSTSPPNNGFFQKQISLNKFPPILRSQSPSLHSSVQQERSNSKVRIQSKIIRIRTSSASGGFEQNQQSLNQTGIKIQNIIHQKHQSISSNSNINNNNNNNSNINVNSYTQNGTNSSNSNLQQVNIQSANNTLYYKKILQNTKVLQQRQKALAQLSTKQQQQLQSNLKTSQSFALYNITNPTIQSYVKYSSPLRGSLSKFFLVKNGLYHK